MFVIDRCPTRRPDLPRAAGSHRIGTTVVDEVTGHAGIQNDIAAARSNAGRRGDSDAVGVRTCRQANATGQGDVTAGTHYLINRDRLCTDQADGFGIDNARDAGDGADGERRGCDTQRDIAGAVGRDSGYNIARPQGYIATAAEQHVCGADGLGSALRHTSLAAQGQRLGRGQRKIVIQSDAVEIQIQVASHLRAGERRTTGSAAHGQHGAVGCSCRIATAATNRQRAARGVGLQIGQIGAT